MGHLQLLSQKEEGATHGFWITENEDKKRHISITHGTMQTAMLKAADNKCANINFSLDGGG